MDRDELYDKMAARKFKPADLQPYDGNNGRVNACAALIRNGSLPSGGTLVDVGGAIGDLGFAVRDLFDQRITVDISALNLTAAEAKGNTPMCLDLDRQGLLGIGDEEVTLVAALDFIEHIVDPEKFAGECFRVLEPGGEVFLNTPNIQFWRHIDQLTKGSFPHTSGDREVYHGGHLYFFTFRDLTDIFAAAGFTGFKQFKDEEHYENPPEEWVKKLNPISQQEFVNACMRLGNSNLLFRAWKPD